MRYEAVLLDLDNTLYPYAPCNEAGKRSALAAFQEHGYDFGREQFDELYATERTAAKRELRGTAASHNRFIYIKRMLRAHADHHDAADALAIGEAYWEGYLDRMCPFDGVEEAMTAIRDAGAPVVVVTNFTTRLQFEKLARLGVDDGVDRLLTSEEVGREKPSALPFTTALAALDVPPGKAVMVGDNPVADVEGANAVGMDSVLFTGGTGDSPAEGELTGVAKPDYRVDEFTALPEVLA
ncbi:MAG: HAD family hydrolase [Halorubrum sp.]